MFSPNWRGVVAQRPYAFFARRHFARRNIKIFTPLVANVSQNCNERSIMHCRIHRRQRFYAASPIA